MNTKRPPRAGVFIFEEVFTAGAEGIEPPLAVLETAVLPLN